MIRSSFEMKMWKNKIISLSSCIIRSTDLTIREKKYVKAHWQRGERVEQGSTKGLG